jgi:hypothetical protein
VDTTRQLFRQQWHPSHACNLQDPCITLNLADAADEDRDTTRIRTGTRGDKGGPDVGQCVSVCTLSQQASRRCLVSAAMDSVSAAMAAHSVAYQALVRCCRRTSRDARNPARPGTRGDRSPSLYHGWAPMLQTPVMTPVMRPNSGYAAPGYWLEGGSGSRRQAGLPKVPCCGLQYTEGT